MSPVSSGSKSTGLDPCQSSRDLGERVILAEEIARTVRLSSVRGWFNINDFAGAM